MFRSLLIVSVLLVSQAAMAGQKLELQVTAFESERAPISKLSIYPGKKKWRVVYNPNTCTIAEGGGQMACTTAGLITQDVKPEVLEDQRGTDGPLTVKLTDKLNLEVGSGFNLEHTVTYTAIERQEDGTEVRTSLTPKVSAIVKGHR